MNSVYLFDWGDTLMVDRPEQSGKMCDWPDVEAVDGAAELLAQLSKTAQIYIATGAADSSETDIRVAFERVELDRYLSGYFCQANLGVTKGEPQFLANILARLEAQPDQVTMVGDNYAKDIIPAMVAGIQTIWLTQTPTITPDPKVATVSSLRQLIRQ